MDAKLKVRLNGASSVKGFCETLRRGVAEIRLAAAKAAAQLKGARRG